MDNYANTASTTPIKILIITAEPLDQPHLRLGEEMRDIKAEIRRTCSEERFIVSRVRYFSKNLTLLNFHRKTHPVRNCTF